MNEFLTVFSNVAFVVLIISSVFFGFSIAVNFKIEKIIKKIGHESDVNYYSIDTEKRNKCDEVISLVKEKAKVYLNETKLIKKTIKNNKLKEKFHLKQKPLPKLSVNLKTVGVEFIEGISTVFYGEGNEKAILKLSEVEIYNMLTTVKNRVKDILTASGVIWLNELPISFFLNLFDAYGKIDKFKNKISVTIILFIVDLSLKFYRLISPVSASKYILKDLSGKELNQVITDTLLTIIGKEFAVICMQKSKKD